MILSICIIIAWLTSVLLLIGFPKIKVVWAILIVLAVEAIFALALYLL